MSNRYEPFVTSQYDDPDPDGPDVYGILPLLTPYEGDAGDEDEDEGSAVAVDSSGSVQIIGASKNDAEESELDAEIEPGFRELSLPKGEKMPDDDPDGYAALEEDLTPGEAEGYLEYMRPLSAEEAELVDDPMFKDLRWVDDPAHVDDVLKSGKNSRGIDKRLKDTTYGDSHMTTEKQLDKISRERSHMNDEELADRIDSDKLASYNFAPLPKTYVPARDARKLALVRGLAKTLQCGHARFLAASDRASGVPARPKSFYMNVAGLWTQNKLNRNLVPTRPQANWKRIPFPILLGAAQTLLDETSGERLANTAKNADLAGWGLSSLNPIKAVKSAYKYTVKMPAKYAYKYTVKMPAKYAYKYGVKMPTKYAYKGVKAVGKVAQDIALRPIKAIIRKFTSTAVNRRAAAIAKQRGLAKPGPAERTAALAWAKNLVRKNKVYGSAIASLMGRDYGIRPVDISFNNDDRGDDRGNDTTIRPVDISFGDEMGISKAGATGLILLGPIGIIGVLTGLFKTKDAQQAAPPLPGEGENFAPGEGEGEGEGEPGAEESYADESYAEDAPAEEYPTDEAGRYRRPGKRKSRKRTPDELEVAAALAPWNHKSIRNDAALRGLIKALTPLAARGNKTAIFKLGVFQRKLAIPESQR